MVLENFLIDVDVLWDRAGKELYEKPEARAGRKMRVRVTNKGLVEDLTGYTLNLGWKSTIDETKFGLDAFTAVDITKGIFEIAYTTGMLTNIGTLAGTLQLVPAVGNATESNNFMITVKRSAVDVGAIQSETSFTALVSALVEVNGWNDRIDAVEADFIQRAIDMEATYPQELLSLGQQLEQAATKNELSAIATPLAVSLAAQMTNVARIYVYTGVEGGYTAGNWYYHNGTTWVSGGVYQASAIGNGAIVSKLLNNSIFSDDIGKKYAFDVTAASGTSKVVLVRFPITFSPAISITDVSIKGFVKDTLNVDTVSLFISPGASFVEGSIVPVTNNELTQDFTDLTYISVTSFYVGVKTYGSQTTGKFTVDKLKVSINGGEYFEIETEPLYWYGTGTVVSESYAYYGLLTSQDVLKKQAYASGIHPFSVYVNQSFPDNVGITTTVQDSESLLPVNCALYLPASYSNKGIPCKIALVAHGAGGSVTGTTAAELATFTELLAAGYAIFDVNGSNNNYSDGSSDHMGSSRALAAYKKAYEYIKANYNVEDKLYVHGHSMGGLLALNFTVQNPSIVKVCSCYHPVTDLYTQAWLDPWFGSSSAFPTRAMIAQEFNFNCYATWLASGLYADLVWEADKVIGFNPIANQVAYDGATKYNRFPVPLKIWHGNADNVVSLAGSQAYIQALKNAGVRCELRIVDGIAHVRTATMRQEEVFWFNRF